ncbi:hypothetical protein SMSP2_02856 [Limihaloglobus sulfuriphilus]|uniref:Ice-binding protein C-terminal domain-containing protein n=1 Tax=Limihaloglobus sulfuriphilus TaxID=1851148 RepID=A0A1Q2MIF6_9BACT|nr:PEP-CTERM sorting domain-containing protein [Limihaloglobus sulfuriphilus]AQQ72471.1 hypothetical protein SMSP2_02856 [Limihaloglobus sulfuriphilus]
MRKIFGILTVISVFTLVSGAGAAIMTYNTQSSYASTTYQVIMGDETGSDSDNAIGFVPFVGYANVSSQDGLTYASSTVGGSFNDDLLSASANIEATSTASSSTTSNADGAINFEMTLSQSATIFFDGSINSTANASAQVKIRKADYSETYDIALSDWGQTDVYKAVNESIVLPAGVYRVDIYSSTTNLDGGTESAGFDLTMTVVPEPATMMIMAAGMLGLLRKRS